MKVYDAFTFNDELDMLRCRLAEFEDGLIYRHVLVEATTSQKDNRPKRLHYGLNAMSICREFPKADIVPVVADNLPDGTAWDRETAQRQWVRKGLVGAEPDDMLLFSDVDEIPTVDAVKRAAWSLRGGAPGYSFTQRCAVFAVDWELPWTWQGTVATLVKNVGVVTQLRQAGFPHLPDGGWHLSWLGGPDAIRRKMSNYCHTEMDSYIARGLENDQFYERGIFWGHGQGDTQLIARDVDESWPKAIYERKCPQIWFRPR